MDEPNFICGENPKCCKTDICPLSGVLAGSSVRIKHITTAPDVARRLREMGFCEEQRVRLLSRQPHLICQVCNARLGLSPQLAEKILVELLPPSAMAS